jgi:gliding motility-associated-like protein
MITFRQKELSVTGIIKRSFFLISILFSHFVGFSQCPDLIMAMVNSCGSSEGLNEFVMFRTTSNGTAADYGLRYGTVNPPTNSTLSGSDAAPITGTGTIVSNGTCSVIQVTSPSTPIPAGSLVILLPNTFDQNYDVSGLCNGTNPIYVIFVRTNSNGGSNSNWSVGGNLGNTPSTPRYLQITFNGNSGCSGSTAPVKSYVAAGNWPSNTNGNFVYWSNNTPSYANNGCSVLGIETFGDTSAVACSSFTWYGQTYTSSTTATYVTTNALGYDSTVTLNLTINQPSISDTIATACDSLQWRGTTYFSSTNTAVYTTLNAAGCDSTIRLNLSIAYGTFNVIDSSSCGPITWQGVNYPNSGTYILNYTNNNGCLSADTLRLDIQTKPALGPDQVKSICFGDLIDLTTLVPSGSGTDTWQLNQTPISAPTQANESGTYQLIRTNTAGCSDTLKITLTVLPEIRANAGMDGIAAQNTPYQLSGSGNGQPSWEQSIYLNYSTIFNPLATINQTTTFILTVTNSEGCVDVDSVKIEAMKGPDVYIPLAFTPNGDGKNDVIKPFCVGISKLEYFRIYNRVGNCVFETNTIGAGWNGTIKGKKQDPQNFVIILKAITQEGKTIFKKQNLLLLQ